MTSFIFQIMDFFSAVNSLGSIAKFVVKYGPIIKSVSIEVLKSLK